MFMLLALSFVVAAIVIYRYYRWQITYWDRMGVPSPPAQLYYGHWNNLNSMKRPSTLQIAEWTKTYGTVYGIYEGLRKILVVSDPDLLQEVFIKKFEYFYGRKLIPLLPDPNTDLRVHVFSAEGSRWKRLRTLTAPTFSTNSLRKIHSTVEDSALHLLDFLKMHADTGKGFDIYKYFQEYTMDVIARIAMGQDGCKQFENPFIGLIKKHFTNGRINNPLVYAATGIPNFPKFLITAFRMLFAFMKGNAIYSLISMVEKTVEERKKQRILKLERQEEIGEPIDFIDFFLDAESPEVEIVSDVLDRRSIKVDRHLTTDEIVAQCLVFLIAGYDTTSSALSFATFLLSKHPEKMKKLQKELDDHCSGRDIEFNSLHKLQYMDCVIKETLRMYPLGSVAITRRCMKETTLGGIRVEKDVVIAVDMFRLHFDKKIWGEDATEFRPERWEENVPHHPLAWLPFGAGPRQCIGMRLAYMEKKLALGHILKNYDIMTGPESEEQLKLTGALIMSPEKVTVYLQSRQF